MENEEISVLCTCGQDLDGDLLLVIAQEEQPLRAVWRTPWRWHIEVKTAMTDDVSDLLLCNAMFGRRFCELDHKVIVKYTYFVRRI